MSQKWANVCTWRVREKARPRRGGPRNYPTYINRKKYAFYVLLPCYYYQRLLSKSYHGLYVSTASSRFRRRTCLTLILETSPALTARICQKHRIQSCFEHSIPCGVVAEPHIGFGVLP